MIDQSSSIIPPLGDSSHNSNPTSRTMSKSELEKVAEHELGETPSSRLKALKELRDWITSEGSRLDCLKDVPDTFLLRFIRMQKTDAKKAANVLDNYVKFRTNSPEWFENLDIQVCTLIR